MAIPATDRKQVIPPHFVSYLDKHRIYELFYDMASSLAMTMPDDHVMYLKKYLVDVAAYRDKSRILIIGPPFIDKQSLAKAVGHLLSLPVISMCDFLRGDLKYNNNPDMLASKFKEFLHSHQLEDEGWILFDYPRSRHEVAALQAFGIRPSHAFQLIPSQENIAERELWNEKFVGKKIKDLTKYMKEYKKRLISLRPSVKHVLKEVLLHRRSLETVARNIAILARQSIQSGGPMLPRVVLIGTRGSFKQTVACSLADQLDVVHVNMDELIAQTLEKDTELSQQLRDLAGRNVRLYGKLIVAILEDRLLDYDCMNKGWVLTGFPRDNKDLAILDMFDTPPNRVIFITNNSFEALERLAHRRVNVYTGQFQQKDQVAAMEDVVVANQFVIHPDDELIKTVAKQKEFDEHIQGMLDYCKGNCIVVDGTGGMEAVRQRVFKAILQAAPPGAVRQPDWDVLMAPAAPITEKPEPAPADEIEEQPPSTVNTNNLPCLRTSLSGSSAKSSNRAPDTFRPPDQLAQSSCTSVFPEIIGVEWDKVMGNAKSYATLPGSLKNK